MKRKNIGAKKSKGVNLNSSKFDETIYGVGFDVIEGEVIGKNSILVNGRTIQCWENPMQASIAPQPLNLEPYMGKVVTVSGTLYRDLWSASFVEVKSVEGYERVTGKVIGNNIIQGPHGPVKCYRHGIRESWSAHLDLSKYVGQEVTVMGDLHGDSLYKAQLITIPEIKPGRVPKKEAKSLNDLLLIRADNRSKIEAVNGNLGTALGIKWTNNNSTGHSCIIVFVPQKTAPWLVPEEEKVPEILESNDGTWCLTDVVTGGKKASLDDIDPLPELSEKNKDVVKELKSGRIGLIGGIQIAFYGDGIEDRDHSFVGTAGIAVKHKNKKSAGFLTNQHVAEERGRQIFHPWHKLYPIGQTHSVKKFAKDEKWYDGVIDEKDSYVRCDCGFVEIDEQYRVRIKPGLYEIGDTGPLLQINSDKMDTIGRKVISVGRTRGVQRGTIVAYAYEFRDDYISIYTDLLIIGEEGNAFSWKGDSGKVIVTDDEAHRPVGLLWGGWQERLRKGQEQEMWSYAIDLSKVLNRLNLELLTRDV